MRTFPTFNENISIGKSFPLFGEKRRLDFRWEAFNLLNRVVFGRPSTTSLDSGTFGVINSLGNTQRQMQVALKLYW